MLRYLFKTTIGAKRFHRALESLGDNGLQKIQEAVMTEWELIQRKVQAESLLRVMRARGFSVSDSVEARVRACHHRKRLNLWIDRAATVSSVHDVFRDEA